MRTTLERKRITKGKGASCTGLLSMYPFTSICQCMPCRTLPVWSMSIDPAARAVRLELVCVSGAAYQYIIVTGTVILTHTAYSLVMKERDGILSEVDVS